MAVVKKSKIMIASLVAALALVLGTIVFWYGMPDSGPAPVIDSTDQALVAQGKTVYDNNCATCHGSKLEGQANWRSRLPNGRLPAPPHDVTGHTWHHPDAVLIDIVKNGLVPGRTAPPGYASDMPAYDKLLSGHEILAVLAYIKSSWPTEALDAQKEVTQQYREQQVGN